MAPSTHRFWALPRAPARAPARARARSGVLCPLRPAVSARALSPDAQAVSGLELRTLGLSRGEEVSCPALLLQSPGETNLGGGRRPH